MYLFTDRKSIPLTPRDKGGRTRGGGGGGGGGGARGALAPSILLTWNLEVGRVTIKLTSGFELVHSILLPYLYYYVCVKQSSFTAPLNHISVPPTLLRDIKLLPIMHSLTTKGSHL